MQNSEYFKVNFEILINCRRVLHTYIYDECKKKQQTNELTLINNDHNMYIFNRIMLMNMLVCIYICFILFYSECVPLFKFPFFPLNFTFIVNGMVFVGR